MSKYPGLKYQPLLEFIREGQNRAEAHIVSRAQAEDGPSRRAEILSGVEAAREGMFAYYFSLAPWHAMKTEEIDLILSKGFDEAISFARQHSDTLGLSAVFIGVSGLRAEQISDLIEGHLEHNRPPAIIGFDADEIDIIKARKILSEYDYPERFVLCSSYEGFAQVARIRRFDLVTLGTVDTKLEVAGVRPPGSLKEKMASMRRPGAV